MNGLKTVRLSELLEVWESFTGWYWFITEFPEENLAFGLVRGWEIEWGYISLEELRQLEKQGKVWKVPKLNWAVCPCVINDGALPYVHQLKGGDMKMEQQIQLEETATMCPTKAGNGYKFVVNGVFFYASKKKVLEMMNHKKRSCVFHTIKDDIQPTIEVLDE